jgi:hypothetical protein
LTELHWEGGSDIQFVAFGYWDGEDNTYDLTSLAGIEQCFGLRSISMLSLFCASDLEPLTRLPHLEKIDVDNAGKGVDWTPLLRIPSLRVVKAPVSAAVAAELVSRGVEVQVD